VVAGASYVGKSLLVLGDFADRVRTGSPWPDGSACPAGDDRTSSEGTSPILRQRPDRRPGRAKGAEKVQPRTRRSRPPPRTKMMMIEANAEDAELRFLKQESR
jgi:hypothetical protein